MAFSEKGAVSKWWVVAAVLVSLVVVPVIVFINSDMYRDMTYMKAPKFEVGEHRGTAFCGSCDLKVYTEWPTASHPTHTTGADPHGRGTAALGPTLRMGRKIAWLALSCRLAARRFCGSGGWD